MFAALLLLNMTSGQGDARKGTLHLMHDEVDFGAWSQPAWSTWWVYSHRFYIWSRCGRLRSLYGIPKSTSPNLTSFSANLRCPVSPSLWGSVSGLPTAYALRHVLPQMLT